MKYSLVTVNPSTDELWQIHKHNCADALKMQSRGHQVTTFEANSEQAAREYVIDNELREMGYAVNGPECKIMPCCKSQEERMTKSKKLAPRQRPVEKETGIVAAVEAALTPTAVPVPEPAAAPTEIDRPYAVLVDAQGVAYLRTGVTGKHMLFVLNTGNAVELVKMDAGTVSSRGLQVVDTDVLDAAKILLTPLTESVIVSERAKTELNKLLNDEEWKEFMASEKKHRSTAKGKKAGARAKSSKTAGRTRVNLEEQEVRLVKFPAEADKVRGNQLAVLEVLKANGKKMTADELVKKLKTPTKNKNGQLAVWTFNRPILVSKGYIAVS